MYENNEGQSWEPTPPESNWTVPKKRKKTGWTGGKVVALTLVCSLISGALSAGAAVMWDDWDLPSSTQVLEGIRKPSVEEIQVETGEKMSAAQVYAANVASTVGITTSVTTNYWGYQTTSAASGSGFILSEDGYVLTNFHVIEGSNSITVSCYDGTAYDAKLIGYDQSNDIAVLKVEADGLTPVILGDSDLLNVGDPVVAIGNPLGELTFSLTSGAVSAKDRQVTMSNGTTMNLIQTDCAINSGNSGGALFNLYGEVVGITNAKYSSSSMNEASIDNIGFAIPMNDVRDIVFSIIEKGYISKPYIGVSVTDVSPETQSYGLPKGAAVRSVTEGSPAQTAGLAENDIITAADDTAITGSSDLIRFIGDCAVGQTVNFTVYRSGQTLTVTVTVGEQVQQANPATS